MNLIIVRRIHEIENEIKDIIRHGFYHGIFNLKDDDINSVIEMSVDHFLSGDYANRYLDYLTKSELDQTYYDILNYSRDNLYEFSEKLTNTINRIGNRY